MLRGTGGSNPSLSATSFPMELQRGIGFMEKYPRGRRGSPAKGVVLDKGSPGSNPGFSAKGETV